MHICVHLLCHVHHPNQMHAHVIMYNLLHLPHYITTPMHQCIFMFICMFMVFKQSKTLNSIKEIKTNKTKQRGGNLKICKLSWTETKHFRKNKKRSNKNELWFLGMSVHAHPNCMRMHTSSMHMHPHIYTPQILT